MDAVEVDGFAVFDMETELRGAGGGVPVWERRHQPPPMSDHHGPVAVLADGREEWTLDEAYRQMTHDEPRALVAVALDKAVVTSWRLPLEGELASEAWASRYYQDDEPARDFVVSEVGPTMYP